MILGLGFEDSGWAFYDFGCGCCDRASIFVVAGRIGSDSGSGVFEMGKDLFDFVFGF